MKLETIYKKLTEAMNDDMNLMKFLKLKEELEQKIREESCYKTTSKTRINAIKRIAGKLDFRPIFTGYGEEDGYKLVTDTYHAIMIYEDKMPLKLVTTDEERIEKEGKENCIVGTYPCFKNIIPDLTNEYTTIKLDFDDITTFHKLHKSNANKETYQVGNIHVNVVYLKNVIDVLGTDIEVYVPTKDYKPLVIKNKNNEAGIVLPIRK